MSDVHTKNIDFINRNVVKTIWTDYGLEEEEEEKPISNQKNVNFLSLWAYTSVIRY